MFYKSIKFLFLNVVDPMSYRIEYRALTPYDNLYTENNTYTVLTLTILFVKYQYYCLYIFLILAFF